MLQNWKLVCIKRNAKARTLVNMMINEANEPCVYLDLFSKERRGTVR